jgi:hypothetical protein
VASTDGLASGKSTSLHELLKDLPGPKIGFSDVYRENEADRSRRSIFLDPTENALSSLIDLYAGTVTTLEIRSEKGQIDFAPLRERAIQIMRGRFPIVSVNLALARDIDEAVDVLLQTARTLKFASNRIARSRTRGQERWGTLQVDLSDFNIEIETARALSGQDFSLKLLKL